MQYMYNCTLCLTLSLDTGGWLNSSCHHRCTPRNNPVRNIQGGGWAPRTLQNGCKKSCPTPIICPQTVQPVNALLQQLRYHGSLWRHYRHHIHCRFLQRRPHFPFVMYRPALNFSPLSTHNTMYHPPLNFSPLSTHNTVYRKVRSFVLF